MSLSNSRGTSLGFRASTCLLASAAIVPGSGANAQPDRANAVFMLADDLGYGSISWYDGDIRAPNMDSVAHNCVGFVSGYVTAPVCNPSRPFMLDREGPGSGRMFGDGRQGGPSGGGEATVARASLPRTPSLKRLGPCLRADDPQGARLEVLLVALADDWLSKDLPALWRGGRCRAWPGPAAGGGSDRVSDWVLVTVVQLDRPPQQFPQDLNGSRGPDPHSKSRGSRESPWPVERIPSNP